MFPNISGLCGLNVDTYGTTVSSFFLFGDNKLVQWKQGTLYSCSA